jgi:hypothetical protein
MASTRKDRIAAIDLEIEQLLNRKKEFIQQEKAAEKKERTHRLCKRGGLLEKLLPETIPLTDEQFETFAKKVLLTDYTKRILANVSAEQPAAVIEKVTETPKSGGAEAVSDTPKATASKG